MRKTLKIILLAVLAVSLIGTAAACADGGSSANKDKGLLYKKTDNGYTITKYVDDGRSETVLDIGKELGADITDIRIKANAFSGNSTLTEIIVPASVVKIDKGAFANMRKLEKLTVPFIGETADSDAYYAQSKQSEDKATDAARTIAHFFGADEYDLGCMVTVSYNSSSSETVYMPNSLKTIVLDAKEGYENIPMYAFNGAVNLTGVEVKGDVKGIGEYAFADCRNLQKVVLPASVKTIYKGAFSGCISLKDDVLSGTTALEKIGDQAFADAEISDAVIPATVKEIGYKAFAGSTVKTVTLPSALEKIGDSAFSGCVDLKSVYTDGVSNAVLGSQAFYQCIALEYVGAKTSETKATIDLAAFKEIGVYAFADLGKRTYTVKNIGSFAIEEIFVDTKTAE